jgi:lysophospholipase L1-like esterase
LFIFFIAVTGLLALAVYALRRTRLVNPALLLFSLSLCLAGLEAYYRFFYAQSDGFAHLSRNFAARYYRYDAFGLRASNLPLSDTKQNVVVIGDSHVFGAGLKTPTERFSEKLAAHYPGLHVINLGWNGWDTKTETKQLQKYLGEPHAKIPLIVLAYFFNDIGEDVDATDRQRLRSPEQPVEPTAFDRLCQQTARQSRFVEFFYYRSLYPRLVRDLLGQMLRFYDDPAIMTRHLASLDEFRSVVEQRYHANLVVVALPFLHSDALLQKQEFYAAFIHKLSERGFNCIDLQPTFASHKVTELWVSRFDPHPNAFANRLIADAITDYLDKHPEAIGNRQPGQ